MNARGGGKVQALFALAVTAALIVAGMRIIPAYGRAMDFKSAMNSQAKLAVVTRKTPDVIQEELFKTAKELDIPIKREDIKVTTLQNGVRIKASFSVPVDLVVTVTHFSFDFDANTTSAY